LAELPEIPGTFELGSLVRSVLLIGAAAEGIGRGVRRALADLGPQNHVHCVRWQFSPEPEELAARCLEEYRRAHRGASPPAQPRELLVAVPRPLLTSRTVVRAEEPPREDPVEGKIFLRAVPAA
jgi:hypothetical protein